MRNGYLEARVLKLIDQKKDISNQIQNIKQNSHLLWKHNRKLYVKEVEKPRNYLNMLERVRREMERESLKK